MDSSLDFHSHGCNLFIGAGVPQRGGVVSTVSWKPLGLLSSLLLLFLDSCPPPKKTLTGITKQIGEFQSVLNLETKNPTWGVFVPIKPGLAYRWSPATGRGVKLQLQGQGRGASTANLRVGGGARECGNKTRALLQLR